MYSFAQNEGVQFDNGAAGNFMGESYAIEMYFRWTYNASYKRVIDYKNQNSDFGIYATSTLIQFYPAITFNTTAFDLNQFVHLVVTRDSATAQVDMYANGQLLGSFLDTAQYALPDGNNVINFFRDDLVFGNEAGPGDIALLRFYNTYLDGITIEQLALNMETTSGAVAFTSDLTDGCLGNNLFTFTNTSENDGNVTYLWDFGDSNTDTGTPVSHSYLLAGTYNVALIADDGNGCLDTALALVTIHPEPVGALTDTVSLCQGDSITLDPGNGFSAYSWSTGSTDSVLVASTAGLYTVTITDAFGCTGIDSAVVLVAIPPAVELGNDTVLCFGQTITLDASPGQASYLWSTGDMTQTINVTVSGIYAVAVSNAAGCVSNDTIEITINPLLTVSLGADTSFCTGSTLTLDAGPGYAAYLWSDNSQNQTLDVTASGTWSVLVTDSFGCQATDTINVNVVLIQVVALGNDTTLCGGTPLVLDAGPGYVGYLWNTGSQNQSIQVVQSGIYSIIVTDSTGCSGSDSITVSFDPFVSLGTDQILCDGLTTTLDPGPGYASYLWNDGSVTQTLDVSVSGTYTVTVTDGGGCTNFDQVTVTFNPLPVFDLGPDLEICTGDAALLDAGQGYYAYLWSDGSVGTTLLVTNPGTYWVLVSSAPNCDASDTISVSFLPAPSVSLGADTSACDGQTLTLNAGAGFISYLWSDGSAAPSLDVTASGTYSVTVTDGNGCENSDTVEVAFEAYPIVELGPPVDICEGTFVTLDAGAGPYSYSWNQGSVSQTINADTAGTYMVTVTSPAGCSSTDDVTVTVLAGPAVDLGMDTTVCDGTTVILDAGPGYPAYLWSDGTMNQVLFVTTPGAYWVMVTGSNACITNDTINIGYYPPLQTPVITQNGNTLTSSAPAGNQWYEVPGGLIPGATGTTYDPGQNGTFFVIVTDPNGCGTDTSAVFPFIYDGLNDHTPVQAGLMPNPAAAQVTIRVTGSNEPWKWEMTDLPGRVVQKSGWNQFDAYTVDLSKIPSGIYQVRIYQGNSQAVLKLVVKH